jgi:hypothetical protein
LVICQRRLTQGAQRFTGEKTSTTKGTKGTKKNETEVNQQSSIFLDALALAADEDAGHGVGGVSGFG